MKKVESALRLINVGNSKSKIERVVGNDYRQVAVSDLGSRFRFFDRGSAVRPFRTS